MSPLPSASLAWRIVLATSMPLSDCCCCPVVADSPPLGGADAHAATGAFVNVADELLPTVVMVDTPTTKATTATATHCNGVIECWRASAIGRTSVEHGGASRPADPPVKDGPASLGYFSGRSKRKGRAAGN